MRSLLDRIYRISGALSGIGIVLICVLILMRVVGRWMGIVVPSSDDFAGYLLAASSFLGLAYTFRQGGHIRVSLFTSRMSEKANILFERFILLLASVLCVFLTLKLIDMVLESKEFEEVTTGYVPVPLWIVQAPLALGMLIFTVAIIDQFIGSLFFSERIPESDEEKLAHQESLETEVTDVAKGVK
ncbi:TRAP transporter small permease [Vibrio viridaestus]|uniref:TRAP transporter small permease protein n=1 Tax=Vibrio viridaestus TaxID=2487322 RepID=A0A3N9TL04_9VIBR|nr:TRAP transporter small permease [Vibrio viridaestus]RQW64957.1 TRAP transporter small permease [Vibrio viridaestus]